MNPLLEFQNGENNLNRKKIYYYIISIDNYCCHLIRCYFLSVCGSKGNLERKCYFSCVYNIYFEILYHSLILIFLSVLGGFVLFCFGVF